MCIVAAMTADAVPGQVGVPEIPVALRAAHQPMQPDEREHSQIVVEPIRRSPGALAMTAVAARIERRVMRRVASMARATVAG